MNKYALIVVSIIGWSLWSICNKIALHKLHPFYIVATSCIVSIILLPIYLSLIKSTNNLPAFNMSGVMWVIAASLCSTLASLAYLFSIRTGDVGTITVITSCTHPALTCILAAIIFNEGFNGMKTLGVIFVICGAVILLR